MTNIDALAFFARSPEAFALYAAFEQRLLSRHPATRVKVQKTQITFSNRYGFAFVSLPRGRAYPKGSLIVSFGLPCRLEAARRTPPAYPRTVLRRRTDNQRRTDN